MAADLPTKFYAKTLKKAYPARSTYKIALYTDVPGLDADVYTKQGEVVGAGYTAGGVVLSGYRIIESDEGADIAFDTQVDWFNADIRCKGALIYEFETGDVLAIKDFGRSVGVIGGIFTVNLNKNGVVGIGSRVEV